MKTKTIFKKSAVLITVIVLAVVMSLATVMALATDGAEDFAGVSVSTSGNINLKFYYDSIGSADSVVYTVGGKTVTVAKEDLKTDASGKYVVEVPLAAAQMTENVTVYTKTGDATGTPHTWTVKKYADKVLANEGMSVHHKAIRSMLTYGAMAQQFFGVNTGDLAVNGVYYGGTSPVANLTSFSALTDSGSVTDGTNIKYSSLDVSAASYTWMRFYFNYTGSAAENLTATISRGGNVLAENVEVKYNAEYGYYVEINNISAKLYNTPYTVVVTDGTGDSLTMTKSVGNWLLTALNSGSDAQKSIAKTMYQYYLMIAGVELDTASCAHTNVHYIQRDSRTYSLVCSDCFFEDTTEIPQGAGLYNSAFDIEAWRAGLTVDGGIAVDENGKSFSQIGREMGCSYKTISTIYNRAKENEL